MTDYTQSNFDKLLKDLNSKDFDVRLEASEKLCWFVEMRNENLDFNYLKNQIIKIIEILGIEENSDIGYKLGETVFEFIWLEKLDKAEEVNFIKRIVGLKTLWVFPSYLEDEDYIDIPGVREYIKRYKNSR